MRRGDIYVRSPSSVPATSSSSTTDTGSVSDRSSPSSSSSLLLLVPEPSYANATVELEDFKRDYVLQKERIRTACLRKRQRSLEDLEDLSRSLRRSEEMRERRKIEDEYEKSREEMEGKLNDERTVALFSSLENVMTFETDKIGSWGLHSFVNPSDITDEEMKDEIRQAVQPTPSKGKSSVLSPSWGSAFSPIPRSSYTTTSSIGRSPLKDGLESPLTENFVPSFGKVYVPPSKIISLSAYSSPAKPPSSLKRRHGLYDVNNAMDDKMSAIATTTSRSSPSSGPGYRRSVMDIGSIKDGVVSSVVVVGGKDEPGEEYLLVATISPNASYFSDDDDDESDDFDIYEDVGLITEPKVAKGKGGGGDDNVAPYYTNSEGTIVLGALLSSPLSCGPSSLSRGEGTVILEEIDIISSETSPRKSGSISAMEPVTPTKSTTSVAFIPPPPPQSPVVKSAAAFAIRYKGSASVLNLLSPAKSESNFEASVDYFGGSEGDLSFDFSPFKEQQRQQQEQNQSVTEEDDRALNAVVSTFKREVAMVGNSGLATGKISPLKQLLQIQKGPSTPSFGGFQSSIAAGAGAVVSPFGWRRGIRSHVRKMLLALPLLSPSSRLAISPSREIPVPPPPPPLADFYSPSRKWYEEASVKLLPQRPGYQTLMNNLEGYMDYPGPWYFPGDERKPFADSYGREAFKSIHTLWDFMEALKRYARVKEAQGLMQEFVAKVFLERLHFALKVHEIEFEKRDESGDDRGASINARRRFLEDRMNFYEQLLGMEDGRASVLFSGEDRRSILGIPPPQPTLSDSLFFEEEEEELLSSGSEAEERSFDVYRESSSSLSPLLGSDDDDDDGGDEEEKTVEYSESEPEDFTVYSDVGSSATAITGASDEWYEYDFIGIP